jgi:hypothetical protein
VFSSGPKNEKRRLWTPKKAKGSKDGALAIQYSIISSTLAVTADTPDEVRHHDGQSPYGYIAIITRQLQDCQA